jgi:hypothetical protein
MNTNKIPVKQVSFLTKPSETEWQQAKMQLERLRKKNSYLTLKVEELENKCIPLDLNSSYEPVSMESTVDSSIVVSKIEYERLKLDNEESEGRIMELESENKGLKEELKSAKEEVERLKREIEEIKMKQNSNELENQMKRVEMKVKATNEQREQMHDKLNKLLSQLNK